MTLWQDALSVLRRHAMFCLDTSDSLVHAENLWHQARLIISRTEQQVKAFERVQIEHQIEAARRAGETLITTFDVHSLMDSLAKELPDIGIDRCFVALYEQWLNPFGFFPVPVLGSLLICPFALFTSCALVLAELLHSKAFRIRAILRSLTSL